MGGGMDGHNFLKHRGMENHAAGKSHNEYEADEYERDEHCDNFQREARQKAK